jgi:nucleotide-binding universal stress UspA family protein
MRILIASDLSAASDEAILQGLSLAGAADQVALCHVLATPPIHALFPQDYAADMQAQISLTPRLAEALRAQARRLVPGHPDVLDTFVEQGTDYAQILERAEAFQADLIVVGSHGRTGFKRLVLGSVAERVVRYAHCNVLVARPARAGGVLVATDLSDASMPAITVAAREAARRNGRLVALHVLTSERWGDAALAMLGAVAPADPPEVREARRELAQQILSTSLERAHAYGEVQVVDGDALDEILRVTEELPAALLVIGTKGHSRVARAVLGGIADELVRHARCSVLAVRQAR